MARIVFQATGNDEQEVELFGSLFLLQPLTRTVTQQLDAVQAKMNDIDDYDGVVNTLAEGLDLRLKASSGTTKASTIIKREWKADKLDHRWLVSFIDQLNEADRPT